MNGLALCAGVGGLELGLQIAMPEYRTVCAVEGEAFAVAILIEKMAQGILAPFPIWSDVRTFNGKPWRGKVDIVSAGYPCQPFSCAGQRRGVDDPRHLWPDIARIIRECRPRFVFLENVANHINQGFYEVARDLQDMGYGVETLLLTAEEVGAPHQRKRLFVLAHSESRRRQEGHADTGRQTRNITGNAGAAMADAAGKGAMPAQQPGQRNSAKSKSKELADTAEQQVGAARLPRQSPTVADASQIGHDGSGQAWRGRPESEDGLPVFPPGPSEHERWTAILAERPDVAPAVESEICRMADGNAGRVDQLRALGNAVVPLVAATAFITLWNEAMNHD